MSKIILAGGSGFLGNVLAKHFHQKLFDVVILSRNPELYSSHARFIGWNGKDAGPWQEEFENAEAVINLTGRSVNCRYNEKNKKEILGSRIDSTLAVGKAILLCKNPPRVWINASSATIYSHSTVVERDESSSEIGDDFSMDICKAWEKSYWEMKTPATRRIVTRTSLGLGNYKNSVLPMLKRLVRFGLGGKMGSGNQSFSWIHEEDYARSIEFLLQRNDLSGIFNTEWMLKIGAILIGTESELILKSRRVIPKRLLDEGFQFRFPDAESALHDLIHRK